MSKIVLYKHEVWHGGDAKHFVDLKTGQKYMVDNKGTVATYNTENDLWEPVLAAGSPPKKLKSSLDSSNK